MFNLNQDIKQLQREIEERMELDHVEVEGLVAEEMGVKPEETVDVIHALEHEQADFQHEHEEAEGSTQAK
jgi:hypothetical protein